MREDDPGIPEGLKAAKSSIEKATRSFAAHFPAATASASDSLIRATQIAGRHLRLNTSIDRYLSKAFPKDSTKAAYKSALRSAAIEHLKADANLTQITRQDFAEFVSWAGTKQRAQATLDGYVMAMSACFNTATICSIETRLFFTASLPLVEVSLPKDSHFGWSSLANADQCGACTPEYRNLLSRWGSLLFLLALHVA